MENDSYLLAHNANQTDLQQRPPAESALAVVLQHVLLILLHRCRHNVRLSQHTHLHRLRGVPDAEVVNKILHRGCSIMHYSHDAVRRPILSLIHI